MFLTTHAVASLTTLKISSNPVLLLGINFLLHYILDIIPHGDWQFLKGFKDWRINYFIIFALDIIFVCIPCLIYANSNPQDTINILYAVMGAILPDILWGISAITKLKFLKIFESMTSWTHRILGNQEEQKIYFLIQILVIGLSLIIIY